MCAGTVHMPCSAPGVSMPMNFRLWQMWLWPAAQAGHCPQGSSGRTVTRSPAFQPVTPLPTAVMVPDISCPMTCGRVKRCAMAP